MHRARKEELVARLNAIFRETALVVVTHQVGLSVAEASELRRRMREAGAHYRVTKNRLARLALEGTPFADLVSLFEGPTAIAYSLDPVAAAKVAVGYARDNAKLTIAGGAFGTQVLDEASVWALAALPSLDELRARMIGLIQGPARNLATVLQAPAGQLARVLSAYGTEDEAA